MTTQPSARILIAGPGALGTIFAALLGQVGHRLIVLARPERAAALREAGSVARVSGYVEGQAQVDVVSRGADADEVDYLVLAVKTPATQSALAALDGLRFSPQGAALSLQNGIAKNGQLAGAFGKDRVLGAASVIGAELLAPLSARCTLLGETTVGELAPRAEPSLRAERFASICREAGLPARVTDDIVSIEWSKLCGFLPGALVTALSRRDYQEMLLDSDLRTPFLHLAREIVAVARREGAVLTHAGGWLDPVAWTDSAPAAAEELLRELGERQRTAGQHVRPSMMQDVLAGRTTEVEDTAGEVVRRARAYGISIPTLETCYRLLRGMERGFGDGA